MLITGTFLDEISHDIPHQNWGREDWDKDFRAMKSIGIDTVILIRCGHKRWLTYPSKYLMKAMNGHEPPVDLVRMFLELAEKYGIDFYFGLYDSGQFWKQGNPAKEMELNRAVAEEVWAAYGSNPAFRGWYINQEVNRNIPGIIELYNEIGKWCKQLSGGLPTMISPYIAGRKVTDDFLTVKAHEKNWDEIMSGIKDAVDVVAFQDGHCEFEELIDYLSVNKALADRYGMQSWTNCENFDRDMPIRFLPIKWEKMLLKLKAAEAAGVAKAITFEFSHFMSPNSCYLQAGKLFERYCEYFNINPKNNGGSLNV